MNSWEWSVLIIFVLFSLRAFLWVVFTSGDEIRVLSPNNLGDLSLHITYIRELASGVPFWPNNPLLTGEKLTYPLGVDLFHSLLTLAGCDIYHTFAWVGIAGCFCTGVALWRWGGAFAMAGFLCNGGLAGFAFFKRGAFSDFQSELAWKSIPLALFVTQRGLLYALPAGLALLCSWRTRFFTTSKIGFVSGEPRQAALPPWGELLLYGTMPVFHFHTFLFLSILLLAWFISRPSARLPIARLVLLAVLPASILFLLVTNYPHGPHAIGFLPGWMEGDVGWIAMCERTIHSRSPFVTAPLFWVVNFGVLPLLVTVLLWKVATRPHLVWARAAVLPAAAVFLLCCFVKFAPWEWDNTKLILWSYLMILPFLWRRVISPMPVWMAAAACFLLFWSGFASLIGGLDGSHTGYPIATRSELDGVNDGLRGIPARSRFIANPDYNHPLVLLGRELAVGYTGHIWSHGYDKWQAPLESEMAILNGAPGWRDLARSLGSRYLFWGMREHEAFPDSTQPWRAEAVLIAAGEWGEIYDLDARPPSESK